MSDQWFDPAPGTPYSQRAKDLEEVIKFIYTRNAASNGKYIKPDPLGGANPDGSQKSVPLMTYQEALERPRDQVRRMVLDHELALGLIVPDGSSPMIQPIAVPAIPVTQFHQPMPGIGQPVHQEMPVSTPAPFTPFQQPALAAAPSNPAGPAPQAAPPEVAPGKRRARAGSGAIPGNPAAGQPAPSSQAAQPAPAGGFAPPTGFAPPASTTAGFTPPAGGGFAPPQAQPAFAPPAFQAPAPVQAQPAPQPVPAGSGSVTSPGLDQLLSKVDQLGGVINSLGAEIMAVKAQNEALKQQNDALREVTTLSFVALHHLYQTDPGTGPGVAGKVNSLGEFSAYLKNCLPK